MQQPTRNSSVALHKLIHNLAGCDLDRTPYVADWKALACADFDLESALVCFDHANNTDYQRHIQVKFSEQGTRAYGEAVAAAKRALGVL